MRDACIFHEITKSVVSTDGALFEVRKHALKAWSDEEASQCCGTSFSHQFILQIFRETRWMIEGCSPQLFCSNSYKFNWTRSLKRNEEHTEPYFSFTVNFDLRKWTNTWNSFPPGFPAIHPFPIFSKCWGYEFWRVSLQVILEQRF